MYLFLQGFTNITKLAYHDPRPFWVDTDIQAFSCSSQYGNPSGHSSTSVGMLCLVWLEIATSAVPPLWLKCLTLPVAMGMGASIMYSRLFLGVHSIDQVVYGAILGIWVALLAHFCCREFFFSEIEGLLENKIREYQHRAVLCTVAFTITVLGFIAQYAIQNRIITRNGLNLPEWTANIALQCESSLKNPYQDLLLTELAQSLPMFGLYWGVLL